MSATVVTDPARLLEVAVTARTRMLCALRRLLRDSHGLDTLREALRKPSPHRATALELVPQFPVELRLQLLPELVDFASWTHGLLSLVREVITGLPREAVLSTIERISEPLLLQGTDEEYRRLLELCILLDRDLTLRLARRAAAHADPEIAEAGNDFLEKLAEADGVASTAVNTNPPTLS